MQSRYKDDARRELYAIEQKIASHRRTIKNTANKKTAAISDKVLISLERQAEALRIEIEQLPSTPVRRYEAISHGHVTFTPRTTPLSEAELVNLEIPGFLRRSAG